MANDRDLKNLQKDFDQRMAIGQWEIVHVDFPSTNTTDVEITHHLQPPDPEYIDVEVLSASGPPLVYKDLSPTRRSWGNGYIILRSPVGSLKADLLLTVPTLRRDLRQQYEGGGTTIGRNGLTSAIAYEDETNTFTSQQNFNGLINAVGGQIQFPATQASSTNANTLDDYEEGSWTPADGSGAGLSFTVVIAKYVKIGKLVHIDAQIAYPTTANGSNAKISGLPFTPDTRCALSNALTTIELRMAITNGATVIDLYSDIGVARTNAEMTNQNFYFSGTYIASA